MAQSNLVQHPLAQPINTAQAHACDHDHDHAPLVRSAHTPEDYGPVDLDAVEEAARALLSAVGEDPERDGLIGTPNRIARMYKELLGGYTMDPAKVINGALFDVEYDDVVLVKNIPFYSLCEHHMLPFYGTAHVAYLPSTKVIGLSKIPRIVQLFARRLQVQERMTEQIAHFIDEVTQPRGVAVFVEGAHMCASMRGIKTHGSRMVTRKFLGLYAEDRTERNELARLVGPVGPEAFGSFG